MKILFIQLIFLGILMLGCNPTPVKNYETTGIKSKVIVEMIDAVNEKNAEKYVKGFAENVKVFVDSEMKVDGRENLKLNRANHFKNHPKVRSEIQHMVEIDDKVILHDKVWLKESDKQGQNIVEIFTFKDGRVSRVDVIQPKTLFQN